MLANQKNLFQLPDDIIYLNCAYMSPLLKSVEEAGMKGMRRKRNPASIKPEDFFTEAEEVKMKIGVLINAKPEQVVIIPSVPYGLKSVVNNIPAASGTHAIAIAEDFPSDYYTIQNWCMANDKKLKIISPPATLTGRGKMWNEHILDAINNDTAIVMMSSISWSDGTKFDLEMIGKRCREVNAVFIVDGTQSVGALSIDIQKFHIDALVCAGYKWLLAPYSIGFAYIGERFNNGFPLEDSWLNKSNASNFTELTSYTDEFKPGASRYNVGEFSNFILLPMFNTALEQILTWNTDAIQQYCKELITPLVRILQEKNCWIEEGDYRTNHLFGFLTPESVNAASVLEDFRQRKIMVSLRGHSIRVSPHLYNTNADIEAMVEVIDAL